MPVLADIRSNLVGHYPLNGDATNAVPGAFAGLPWMVTAMDDRHGNASAALEFNGVDAYVDLYHVVAKPDFPVTIAAWVRPDALGSRMQIFRNDANHELSSRGGFSLAIEPDGALTGEYFNGDPYNGDSMPTNFQGASTSGTLTPGEWQHVAVVFNAHLDWRFYIDGMPVGHVIDPDGIGAGVTYHLIAGAIGWRNSSFEPSFFDGGIDDVRIYDRALSDSDLKELAQGPELAADFNGDGTADVVLRDETSGQWQMHRVVGLQADDSTNLRNLFLNPSWQFQAAVDMDGDADADILLRDSVSGSWRVFEIQTGEIQGNTPLRLYVGSEWVFQGTFDGNDDAVEDVILRHTLTGAWRVFTLRENNVQSVANLGLFKSPNWLYAGAGDMDDDGDDDLLLRHATSGAWRVFEIQSGTVVSVVNLGIWKNRVWSLQALQDMDGDNDADILLRHSLTGAYRVFAIEDRAVQSVLNPGLPQSADWRFRSLNDYDGDGDADVLLRNVNGRFRMFEIEGRVSQGGVNPGLPDISSLALQTQ